MKKIIILLLLLTPFFKINAQAPSTQASNVVVTGKSITYMSFGWTRGSGQRCMVVIRQAASSYAGPPSSTNTNYTANSTFGNGSNLGSSNFVAYIGTGNTCTIYGLNATTDYVVYVYEFNTLAFNISHYNTSTTGNYIYCATFSNNPTNPVINSVSSTYNSASVSFTPGNGNERFGFAKLGTNGTTSYPPDGYVYVANSAYGSGNDLGSQNFSVYSSGAGSSFSITNLQPATGYYVLLEEVMMGTAGNSTAWATNTRNYSGAASWFFYTQNNPPTISLTSTSGSICEAGGSYTINFNGVSDGSTLETQNVTVSATSSNTTLLPNANIAVNYTTNAATGSVTVTPATGQSGTVTVTITANDGFSTTPTTSKTFTLTVNPLPSAAGSISANGTTAAVAVCGGNNMTLSVPAIANASSYSWTLPSGWAIVSGTGTSSITASTPLVTAITNYNVQVKGGNACGLGVASTRTVQIDPKPANPNAGPDQINLCGSTAFLSGNAMSGSNVGTWTLFQGSPAPSIGSASSASTSVTGLTNTNNYKFIWTTTYTGSSCPAKKDTVSLSTNWTHISCQPAAAFSYSPTSDVGNNYVCSGTNLTFTDLSVSANGWEWDFNYNGTIPNITSTSQNPTHTYSTPGTYTVYLRIFSTATGQFYNTTQIINVIGAPAAPGVISGSTTGICAGSASQFTYSIAAVNNATAYAWTLPTGGSIVANPSSTSITVMFDTTAVPGNMTVVSTNSCGTSSASTLTINLSPLPGVTNYSSGNTTVCQGEQGVVYSITPSSNATSYEWVLIDGSIQTTAAPTYTYNIGLNELSGRIYFRGVNACGNGPQDAQTITVNPLPANVGSISGNNYLTICPIVTNGVYSVAPVANATSYTWALSQGTIVSGNNTDNVTIDFTGVTSNTTLQVVPSNACGVRDSTPVFSIDIATIPTVDICVVTVDTASLHNEIFWTRPSNLDIDSFRIYRKITATTDTLVGTVGYNDPAQFTDTLSDYNPNTNAEEYTITAVDTCGNEGAKSAYHQTMFLATSLGVGTVNLSWNLYVGQTVNSYRIWRDSTGLPGAAWELLDGTVPPAVTTWIDLNPPLTVNNVRYLVDVDWATFCDPTRGPINTSRSNIRTNSFVGIKENAIDASLVSIFPNPATNNVSVEIAQALQSGNIEVYDVIGQMVYSSKINGFSRVNLNLANYAKGIYNIKVYNGKNFVTKKLIVE